MTTIANRVAARMLAAALMATPLLWLAAEVVSPPLKAQPGAQLAVIAAHPSRWYAYTVLLVAGTITLLAAALALYRLAAAHAPNLAALGAALISFSAIIAVGDATTQLLIWQMANPHADRAQMTALLDRYDHATGASMFFLPGGLALLVGTVLIVWALLRARVTARTVVISFGVGLAINLVGFMNNSIPTIAAGAALMIPGAAACAHRLAYTPAARTTSTGAAAFAAA